MKKITRYCLLVLVSLLFIQPVLAEGFLSVGEPEHVALTQAQSKGQVLLISFRLISCLPEGNKTPKKAVQHVSCGEGPAEIVYQEKGTMREGIDRIFVEEKPMTLSFIRPQVMFGKDGYKIKAKAESQSLKTQTSVKVSLSKVISDHVLASVIVTEDRTKLADVVVHYGEKEYVNPTPVPYRRMMTARQKFKLGEMHNLTGDLWVEIPSGGDVEILSGEKQRLFLELSIK